ncbi:mobile mystery protein B [Asticcacaulis benevestitus]|uniref:Fido domain-containing protein n=1 Tax=Asticcacaulis benevestitus DSM 16100 = ATCC BAA-896 TaxID=1121022 RepID=V4P5S3_9CAUL|nr:mobile mystery protein B [Asticcacaulis benevestitus]ESQ82484.1 hypothetical protein ABENE_20940 [Asticcacaulis benevestitus DSM 16100 = ATCC BAA-896]
MTDPLMEEDDASPPITPEEREGVIPSYITLRAELNEAEQANIFQAQEWAFKKKRDILSEKFLTDLHKRMFKDVWKWAGVFRRTGPNIGVDPYRIGMDLHQLLGDVQFWIDNATYEPDEIATRFHHRLVQIHPFPNGNGRHSRLATDLLLVAMNRAAFTWGSANLVDASETRKEYGDALREADNHDITRLSKFVRS